MRGRASVATLAMWARLVPHLYSSGSASSGLPPSAAAFANSSAFSLPGIPWRGQESRGLTGGAGAKAQGHPVWADGSRLDNGGAGAACDWKTQSGWTGQRYHLAPTRGSSALKFTPSTGHFSDITSPGQRFAVAAMEVCTRWLSSENEVTIR